MKDFNIEQFFLETWLKISNFGICIVLITDVIFFPQDLLSIGIDVVILFACFTAYRFRKEYPKPAVIFVSLVVLLAMIYQCIQVPVNTTTSLSILLVISFTQSVMHKGRTFWIMHGLTFFSIQGIFIYQYLNPSLRFSEALNEVITVDVTYSMLYFILNYGTKKLKDGYDTMQDHLLESNSELAYRTKKIEEQNIELKTTQDELHEVNAHLESLVEERTKKIIRQNEILYQYSYTNAHHLRGPVARILGLANLNKLNPKPDPEFIIESMVKQAYEIDEVVKKINKELDIIEIGYQNTKIRQDQHQ